MSSEKFTIGQAKPEMEKLEKIFIVPQNDLESVEIVNMLKGNGYKEGKDLFITSQGWGASWDNLEDNIKTEIEKAAKQGTTVFGVELQGQAPENGFDIDHHTYGDDDRYNVQSSIEQVAEFIGVPLDIDQRFISVNDTDFIPGMEKLAQKLHFTEDEAKEVIADIRRREREIKGTTPEQERQAEEAINNKTNIGDMTVVALPHSNTATVCDRIYETEERGLFIACADGEVDFYGPREICDKLLEQNSRGWAGGGTEQGFFGATGLNESEMLEIQSQAAELVAKMQISQSDNHHIKR